MTEYDYSPEAYERYLSTQRRIASWVDRTETCRPQFANALAPPSEYLPGHEPDSRSKRPGRRLQRRQSQHFRSRSPSVDSSSSEEYGYRPNLPGPMPMRSAPGHLGSFPAAQMPWNQPLPMVSPHSRPMPPSYYAAPNYRDYKSHMRAQSYGPRHYPAQPMMYSPPVSPGPYGFPPPPPPPGYVVVPQPHHGRPIPYGVSFFTLSFILLSDVLILFVPVVSLIALLKTTSP